MKKALVLCSGGQDSTICLAWALSNYDYIETVSFQYGQRHRIELNAKQNILNAFSNEFRDWQPKIGKDHTLDLPVLGQISETALTRNIDIEQKNRNQNKQNLTDSTVSLPNTFVPARNLVFLTIAAALAYQRGILNIITGVCEADYSGYPDCREETIKAQEKALFLGTEQNIKLITPLMQITKSESWSLAEALGGKTLIRIIIEKSHTCYMGDHTHFHEWGYGCAHCPACKLRKNGYMNWKEQKARLHQS